MGGSTDRARAASAAEPSDEPTRLQRNVNNLIQVKKSSIHGKGLFAKTRIPKSVHIGNYEGPETHEDGAYVLWCYDEEDNLFGIDGQNSLRFTNHSSKPNAVFRGDELWTLREIEPGEEITFDYGDEWKDD